MTSDPDIFRAAKLYIDQHGADATLHAAERVVGLLKDGDLEGATVWKRILRAIEERGRGRQEGEAVN